MPKPIYPKICNLRLSNRTLVSPCVCSVGLETHMFAEICYACVRFWSLVSEGFAFQFGRFVLSLFNTDLGVVESFVPEILIL
jgi:hypothetical protein